MFLGKLYTVDELQSGRLRINDDCMLAYDYNVCNIGNKSDAYVIDAIIEQMNCLENVAALAKLFHIDIPKYFFYSPAFHREINDAFCKIEASDSVKYKERILATLRMQYLHSIMHYTNLRPEDPNPTLQDYMRSMYCTETKMSDIERAFRHPEKWESKLFKKTRDYVGNVYVCGASVSKCFLGNLLEYLQMYHIPYRIENEKTLSEKFLSHLVESNLEYSNNVVVVVPAGCVCLISELIRMSVADTLITREEFQYGQELLEKGQYYGFYMELNSEKLQKLRKLQVEFGVASCLNTNLDGYSMRGYFVARLQDKPLVDEFLTNISIEEMYKHHHSVAVFTAVKEKRIPTWNGEHQIFYCRQGNERGALCNDGTYRLTDLMERSERKTDADLEERNGLVEEIADQNHDNCFHRRSKEVPYPYDFAEQEIYDE